MKTDKILQLIQQKNVMRSGGALPLPKHQNRGQVAPYITSDPKEFAYREDLRRDSLDLYNRQNLYNAQFLANFPNAPVIPNDRVDFRDLVNLVRQQDKKSVEKNVTGLVDILKEHIEPSKTYSRHYPSDPRYKAHVKRTEGPLLKPGHYVPNSAANRRGLLDSLGVFDDDTKSAKHSYDERLDDAFARTWIRSGSVTQKWKNPLFDDEHTNEVFGVPYRVVHHPYIKPVGNLLYHQRIPFSTGSSGAAGIFDPSSAMYDDASALNVSLPYYKKPVQEVIYNPRSNVANSPIIVTDRNDPRIGYYTEAGNQIRYRPPAPMSLMPMRGMPSADVEAVPQKVAVPPTPALRPGFMDMRGEWSDVLPTAYPYSQDPKMLEKMGYRGSKKEGGLAKAQTGLPKNNPYLPNTPLATGAAESVMGPIDYALLPSQLPIKAASALGRGAIMAAEILNPLGGLRPSPDMMYRGLGREGFEDAIQAGVLRPKQNVPPIIVIGEKGKGRFDMAKRFENTFYSPDATIAMDYGKNFVAAVPRSAADFVARYRGSSPKHWSQFTSREIPINEATFYQKYPVVGYKKKLSFKEAGGLTASKAKEILHDKSVHGKPLTEKQRRFFGAIASGNKVRVRLPKQ